MIDQFQGTYRFLSNFYNVAILYEGLTYPSVEHAYQAAKTLDQQHRAWFLSGTAAQAKRRGRTIPLRPNWEVVKVEVMRQLLHEKFAKEPLRGQLVATAPQELVEGNWWGDRYWGVCNGQGLNMLGKLLMEIRDSLGG